MECQFCSRKFTRSFNLQRHLTTVHNSQDSAFNLSHPNAINALKKYIQDRRQLLITTQDNETFPHRSTPQSFDETNGYQPYSIESVDESYPPQINDADAESNEDMETSLDTNESFDESEAESEDQEVADCVNCEEMVERKKLLGCLRKENVNMIFGIIEDILSGKAVITSSDKEKLRKYKTTLRKLRDCKTKQRKEYLVRSGGSFLKDLLLACDQRV